MHDWVRHEKVEIRNGTYTHIVNAMNCMSIRCDKKIGSKWSCYSFLWVSLSLKLISFLLCNMVLVLSLFLCLFRIEGKYEMRPCVQVCVHVSVKKLGTLCVFVGVIQTVTLAGRRWGWCQNSNFATMFVFVCVSMTSRRLKLLYQFSWKLVRKWYSLESVWEVYVCVRENRSEADFDHRSLVAARVAQKGKLGE